MKRIFCFLLITLILQSTHTSIFNLLDPKGIFSTIFDIKKAIVNGIIPPQNP